MNKIMRSFAAFAAMACISCSSEPQLTKSGLDPERFVSEYNGKSTALYTLTNDNGMEVCITNYGGRIVSIMVPDRNGEFKDVVHGFDNVVDYYPENHLTDFGAAIGRYANRIDHGHLNIDGVDYQLTTNNYGHCLHGGTTGWQYQVYSVVEADGSHLKLRMDSPDGDNGFPGNVTALVEYTLNNDNSISITYEAETDAPTVINLTNHSYFNLSGDASHTICDNLMTIKASGYTPVDSTFMTTGEILPVEGTPMDFRTPKEIGRDIDADFEQVRFGLGYDHNWCFDNDGDMTVPVVSLCSPVSGITLDVYTCEPGVQFYTGNFLDSTCTGKNGVTYDFRTAVILETQHFPDSPNKPQWPSVVLRPGEKYHSMCTYAFGISK